MNKGVEEIRELLKKGRILENVQIQMGGQPSQLLNAIESCLSHISTLKERVKELEIQLKAADEGMLNSSNPNSPWKGLPLECLGWQKRARKAEKQYNLARDAEHSLFELNGKYAATVKELYETEQERNRLSKLLIEERIKVVALKDAIDKHEEWKRSHERVILLGDEELYRVKNKIK